MKKVFALLAALFCSSVFAQSSPGLFFGQVPSPGQWNSYFASKIDYVVPSTANNVLTSNGTTWYSAAPTFSNLTGSVACSQMPALTGNATTTAGNCAVTVVAVNHIIIATAPTIASGFGTSPSIAAVSTAAFKVTVGSAPGSTGVLTMPSAPNGWVCRASDITNNASETVDQSAFTTTSVTLTGYSRTTGIAANFTASDVILVMCLAF